jgi:FKBP-type peptidyl-prolyl cis-trans isomerase
VQLKELLVVSDGCDQLDNEVGKPKVGDFVQIHVKGWYIKEKAGGTKKEKKIEFDDTLHRGTKVMFRIEKEYFGPIMGTTQSGKDLGVVVPGLAKAVKDMSLGEEARFIITPEEGYGSNSHQGYCGTVPPNATLVLDVTLMEVARDKVWHARKQPPDTSCMCWKFLYCVTRAY